MALSPGLMALLACPRCKGALLLLHREADAQALACRRCGLAFPVVNGIPVMLLDEATPFDASGATGALSSGGPAV